jgi:hypothetical protein
MRVVLSVTSLLFKQVVGAPSGVPFFLTFIESGSHSMFPTTYDTETELSAVNSILGSIGQSPVTTLDFENPEVAMVYRTLQEVNDQCQAEGWVFNTEYRYPLLPDSNNEITFPQNVLQWDLSDTEGPWMDAIKRDGKLYDLDVVWKFPFEDLPHPFKQYITYRASKLTAAKLMSDPQLFKLLEDQEGVARATCMEYECNQGDYNYLGYPRGTAGRNYRPYQALIR